MRLPRPQLIDSTWEKAKSQYNCDCVMLKYDGFPVVVNVAGTTCNIFANWLHRPQELIESLLLTDSGSALLIGAKAVHTPSIYLYDTWGSDGQSCLNLPFRERYVMTRIHAKILKDPRFQLVPVFPIAKAPDLWLEVMQDPVNLKGLVYRNSKDTAEGTLYTHRYYREAPIAFQ